MLQCLLRTFTPYVYSTVDTLREMANDDSPINYELVTVTDIYYDKEFNLTIVEITDKKRDLVTPMSPDEYVQFIK